MSSLAPLLLLAAAASGTTSDFGLDGYLDLRLQANTSDEVSWLDGGLGKARHGAGDEPFQFGSGAVTLRWTPTPALLAVVDLQANPRLSPDIGVLEAYLRYRPVSTTAWRGSVRAGAFFPPVSLENVGVGWTSPWTLTPSAINSWVGEELRNIGVEARAEHRGSAGTLEVGLAAFRRNDPAGELLATRGWALGDLTSALGSRLRQPDVHAVAARGDIPLDFEPFVENDGRTGWQADVAWRTPAGQHFTLTHYDNRADPESFERDGTRKVFSWRTRFTGAGAELARGPVLLLTQLMTGSTAFEPRPGNYLETRFHAGYLLVGWVHGNWSPALRFDAFSTRREPDSASASLSEHGHAWTAALNWRPTEQLRLTGEILLVDSDRGQRSLAGLAPGQSDQQFQLSLRLLF